MSSTNGPRAVGTDGYDFQHRQRVATQYHISAVNKSRLKWCILAHLLLFLLMSAKLAAAVLDWLDVFVMEVEELELPPPHRWEYVWAGGMLFAFAGLSAARRNRTGSMQFYVFGVLVTGLAPIAYAATYYGSEMWTYASTRQTGGLQLWRGMPVAVLVYVFVAAALQVHGFSLYFAWQLLAAWRLRGAAAKAQ